MDNQENGRLRKRADRLAVDPPVNSVAVARCVSASVLLAISSGHRQPVDAFDAARLQLRRVLVGQRPRSDLRSACGHLGLRHLRHLHQRTVPRC